MEERKLKKQAEKALEIAKRVQEETGRKTVYLRKGQVFTLKPNPKVDVKEEVIKAIEAGESVGAIAKKYGVSRTTVYNYRREIEAAKDRAVKYSELRSRIQKSKQ
ncbi:helix-turn-helix domain-containing protein [Cruoricaptor ignavus]|nr:helix-turn-helix domain-containing protein [Cruoricaptor ignavus]